MTKGLQGTGFEVLITGFLLIGFLLFSVLYCMPKEQGIIQPLLVPLVLLALMFIASFLNYLRGL